MGHIVNGMALVVCIYTTADLSGAHLNPAVTLSLCIAGFYPLLHGDSAICLLMSSGEAQWLSNECGVCFHIVFMFFPSIFVLFLVVVFHCFFHTSSSLLASQKLAAEF